MEWEERKEGERGNGMLKKGDRTVRERQERDPD